MKWHDIDQNTEEWLSLRMGKITGSRYPMIMANEGAAFGDPAKRYALSLALQRLTGKRARTDNIDNEHTERGHQEEPLARMAYENLRFVEVKNGGFFDWGFYGTSPDGLVEEDGVIEIKSVISAVHYATIQRNSFDPAYKWQIVGHLEGTGRQWVDFVSYCPDFPEHNQLFIHRVQREEMEDEIRRLKERREAFNQYIIATMDRIRR